MRKIVKINYNPSIRNIGPLSCGKYLPDTILTNASIEKGCGLTEGTIFEKTGIIERRIASTDETASSMAYEAAIEAIEKIDRSIEDIDLIVVATFTGDYTYPSTALKLKQMLNLKDAECFDVMANCTGFQTAIDVASTKMKLDPSLKCGLVIGLALQSRFLDWTDGNSCIFFGDGAGATVLGDVPQGFGVLASCSISNTKAYEAVRFRGGGSSFPPSQRELPRETSFYEMNGMEVWKQVIVHQPKSMKAACSKIGIALEDIDFFIFHQANLNLIEFLMGKIKQPMSRTIVNIQTYGNTAEASMAIALADAYRLKKMKSGDLILLSGVGAGFAFGSTVIRWWESDVG